MLLIIDAQNDFCNPKGSLFVQGAEEDNKRLSKWILDNKDGISGISVTLDTHQPIDIAHPAFWQDKNGKFPNPFTIISSKDVEDGVWTPRFRPVESLKYLKDLEAQGEYPHCIWPEHCIGGSWGNGLDENVLNAIKAWTRDGNFYRVVVKGNNPYTEHFGAFEAQIPITGKQETQLNLELIRTLEKYNHVYLAGQAKSHCVANTLKQVMKYAPELAKKFVILEDCMSNVTGFEHIADKIYADAKQLGVRFSTTAQESLVSTTVTA